MRFQAGSMSGGLPGGGRFGTLWQSGNLDVHAAQRQGVPRFGKLLQPGLTLDSH